MPADEAHRTALPKDSKLARESAHYKVCGEKILRELKEQMARKSAEPNKPKLQTSAKTKGAGKPRQSYRGQGSHAALPSAFHLSKWGVLERSIYSISCDVSQAQHDERSAWQA